MGENFLKEKVAYYKLWVALLYTTYVGLIAWAFNNFGEISGFRFILVYFVILAVSSAIIIINQKTRIFIGRIGG